MAEISTIIIVGAGLAGVSAAGTLRELGFAGRVLLIGNEAEVPYDRPPLSKAVLVSSELSHLPRDPVLDRFEVPPTLALRAAGWYEQHRIECMFADQAIGLDTAARILTTAQHGQLRYDGLILTTGARARRLPAIEAGPTPHVYLRSLHDAVALRKHLQPGRKLVLLGGGVIGMEVAASARSIGCEVTVLEMAPRIMARALPAMLSDHVADYHRAKGVRLHLGAEVVGTAAAGGSGLVMRDGTTIPADVIVIGIGVEANTELAVDAGMQCRDGILVDRFGATSAAGVYAAGDAVRYPDAFLGTDMRGESWMHAQNQAITVARNLLGAAEPYAHLPYVWSDQFDLKIQVTGRFNTAQHVLRGDPATNRFMWLHLADGKVVGASGINESRDIKFAQKLIEARVVIDREKLADPAFNLKKAASG
jgi:3-phenylpropionate/trans-cinnamate dioxygenase ferredoxin reductase subunit